MDKFLALAEVVGIIGTLVIFSGIGYLTAVIQKFTILRLKDNVHLSLGHLLLEITIVVVSAFYMAMEFSKPSNDFLSENCKAAGTTHTNAQVSQIDYAYSLISPKEGQLDFKLLISALVVLYTLIMILMLQRTQKLGELIMMVDQMINELGKFIVTFGLLIVGFIIVGR